VLFYEEGLMATVKVFERGKARYMSIDGITIASTGRSLMQKEKLIAYSRSRTCKWDKCWQYDFA